MKPCSCCATGRARRTGWPTRSSISASRWCARTSSREADPFLTQVGTLETDAPGAAGAEGPRQSRAGLRVPAGGAAAEGAAGARARAAQRAVFEQGAARHGLGGCGARRLPEGAGAVDGAARAQPARRRRAGVLSRRALCLRQARTRAAQSAEYYESAVSVLRCRERAPRRCDRAASAAATCSMRCWQARRTRATAGSGS